MDTDLDYEPRSQPEKNLRLGRLNEIVLKKRIGSGTSSEIWLAFDIARQEQIAVKLAKYYADHKAWRKCHMIESRALLSVGRPHVPRCHTVGYHRGINYIAMEYIKGHTLADEVGRKPVREVLEALVKSLTALEAVHKAGVVHRDIKPANIMRRQNGDLVIIDFGLSYFPEDDTGFWKPMVGTPRYMALEVTKDGYTPNLLSDIYSLGATFYQILTNYPPYIGEYISQIFALHRDTMPLPPSVRKPGLSYAVDDLFLKALEKDPAKRYASCAEFRTVTEEVLRALEN